MLGAVFLPEEKNIPGNLTSSPSLLATQWVGAGGRTRAMQMSRLRAELRIDEGLRLKSYKDSLGYLTIGYGHQDSSVKEGQRCTMIQAEEWLRQDIVDAIEATMMFLDPVDLGTLSEVRQRALANMAFNLGFSRLSKFKKMKAALMAGDWKLVAIEALDSLWARQVGDRAKRIARMLEEG